MIDLDQHPCCGRNLDRLIQPAVLLQLARDALHGYALIQALEESPMFAGSRPDPAGVYRYLKAMELRGLVSSEWDTAKSGPAKRIYRITKDGLACLDRWMDSLRAHRDSIQALLAEADGLSGRGGRKE
ncbi:MAG: helix-turn-helix transcriptional regulator [Thermodesulfobacteriota bacterium]